MDEACEHGTRPNIPTSQSPLLPSGASLNTRSERTTRLHRASAVASEPPHPVFSRRSRTLWPYEVLTKS